MALWLPG
ncbi:hypothetical protein ECTW07945_5145, partial [Escherichia coli TW07945]